MDFSETRRHQEDKPLTGAVEYMRRLGMIRPRDTLLGVPSPSLRRAARCWPSAGLRGGQVAVSSHVLWIVGGRLPLRGYRGLGPVRASVVLSQVLARSRGHKCRTLRGTGSVSIAILTIRKVPGWHVRCVPSATEVAVRAVLEGSEHWGPPCSDDPVSSSGRDPGPRSLAARICSRTPLG